METEGIIDPADSPMSLIEEIKTRRIELAKTEPQPFDIPGYNGLLVAKYHLMDFDDIRKIIKRHSNKKDARRIINSQIDTLIAACEGLYYRKDDDLFPLSGSDDDPIRYDKRLAEVLGMNTPGSARDVVLGLFNNDLALMNHHDDVIRWMRGVDDDDEGEV